MPKAKKYLLYGILAAEVFGVLLALIFSNTLICDDFEHLRMTYLVSLGRIPYIDFFQHHHPLLWYLFTPFILWLPQNMVLILYVARIIAFSVRLLTFYVIYRIMKQYFGKKKLFIFFLLAVFSFYPMWYGFSSFKPDIFSQFFYFAGLLYFFKYLQKEKIYHLCICGLYFTIGFLFLQTIVFEVFPLIIPLAIKMKNNRKTLKDTVFAMFPSLLLLAGCACLLHKAGIWNPYFEMNWLYNLKRDGLTDDYTKIHFYLVQLLLMLAAWSWLYKKKKTNLYINSIGFLYVFSFVHNLYFSVIHLHYLIPMFIYGAMLSAPILKEIFSDSELKDFRFYGSAYFIIFVLINFTTLRNMNNLEYIKTLQQMKADRIMYTVNLESAYFQVYAAPVSFYEVNRKICALDDELFDRFPDFDINKLINAYKPKYLDYKVPAPNDKFKNERFTLSKETIKNYRQIAPSLWQRNETF